MGNKCPQSQMVSIQRYLVFWIGERTGQEDDRVRLKWEHGIVDALDLGGVSLK
jgi:hypothetical protein